MATINPQFQIKGIMLRNPRAASAIMSRSVRGGVHSGIRIVDREVKSRTRRDTGALIRGFFTHVTVRGLDNSLIIGFQRNTLRRWKVAEVGRRPGRQPPTQALQGWAFRKLGDRELAYVVARAIGRRGIPPVHMVRNGFTASRSRVKNRIQQGYVRGLREIERAA